MRTVLNYDVVQHLAYLCVLEGALFTGKERDAESGNDYFGARYYASSMGRFLSPDWSAKAEPLPYAKLDNPQTLNLYNYMRNNPLTEVDADGHCAEDACVGETVVGIGILAYGAVAGLQAYESTPAGQRSMETFTSAAGNPHTTESDFRIQ
jgi:RHS repeat-associated protein